MLPKVFLNLELGMFYGWWTWMTILRSFWKCREKMLFVNCRTGIRLHPSAPYPTNKVRLFSMNPDVQCISNLSIPQEIIVAL